MNAAPLALNTYNVSDSDFAASGLKAASLIRLGFLAVMPASKFLGVIGSISTERRMQLLKALGIFAGAVAFRRRRRNQVAAATEGGSFSELSVLSAACPPWRAIRG